MEKLRFKQMKTFYLFIDENLQFQAKTSASLINHYKIIMTYFYRNRKLSEIHMDV